MSAIRVVRHPRARRARLTIDPASGTARLTLPPRASLKAALRWAEGQQQWIAAQRARLPQPQPLVPGGMVPFRGETLTIDWCAEAPRRVRREGGRLICGGPAEGLARRITACNAKPAVCWYAGPLLTSVTAPHPMMPQRIVFIPSLPTPGHARHSAGS